MLGVYALLNLVKFIVINYKTYEKVLKFASDDDAFEYIKALIDYHLESLKIIIYLIFNPFYSKDNLLIFEIFETLVVSYNNKKNGKNEFIKNINEILNQLNKDKINEFANNVYEKINFSGQYIDYLKEFLNNLNCYRFYNIENNNVNNNNNNIKILKLKFLPS